MSKPLQPLRFVPFEESHLAKVASVIEKLVMARECVDKAKAFRIPRLTLEQYRSLSTDPYRPVIIDMSEFPKQLDELQNFFTQDAIAQQFIDEKGNSL